MKRARLKALVCALFAILRLSPSLVAAQGQELRPPSPERRTMLAVRMSDDESIVVDGDLSEPVWKRAVPATDFIQQDPQNGAPATERTEVRIVYNRTTLYIGVTCFDDEPNKLLRFQMRRDQFLQSDDRFMWVIDRFLTAQNGYHFETNPSGLMGDALIGPAGYNRDWDGIWTERVRRTDIGWTVEIAIPFTTLNFDPSATSWGINFQRSVRRKNEESLWNGWARNQGLLRLSNTGLVVGMNQNVTQGVGLDIRPYALAAADASPVTGQPTTSGSVKAGLDLFYSLTPGLRCTHRETRAAGRRRCSRQPALTSNCRHRRSKDRRIWRSADISSIPQTRTVRERAPRTACKWTTRTTVGTQESPTVLCRTSFTQRSGF